MSLHDGEIAVDDRLVRTLLIEQAPALAALPLRRLTTTGTVNHVVRLGDALLVRLPRLLRFGEDVRREAAMLPVIARTLPVAVPEVVVLGEPTEAYPVPWSVVRWIDGAVPAPGGVPVEALADAVLALRSIPADGLPAAGRPTAEDSDDAVRSAVRALDGFDRDEVLRGWDAALAAPPWDGRRVPVHADLLPPNLIVRDGSLAGVIDWGSAGAGDPANDVVPAWSLFRGADRARYRALVGVDGDTWARARGLALAQALVAIPYYDRTNPAFAALCRATLTEVLTEGPFTSR